MTICLQNYVREGTPRCGASKLLMWKLFSLLRGLRSWVLRAQKRIQLEKRAENTRSLSTPQNPSNLNQSVEKQKCRDAGNRTPDLLCTKQRHYPLLPSHLPAVPSRVNKGPQFSDHSFHAPSIGER